MIKLPERCRVAVLGARSGRNALDFISEIISSEHCDIMCLFANKPYVTFQNKMKELSIPCLALNHEDFDHRKDYEDALIDFLKEHHVNTVVSCSFSRLLSKDFLRSYPVTINSHPSLLPAFKGRTPEGIKPIDAALDYGVKFIGATIHFIDEHVDNGPIIMQGLMPVNPSMSREDLMDDVLTFEVKMKVQAILWLAQGRLSLQDRSVFIQNSTPYSTRLIGEDMIQIFTPGFDS